MENLEFDIEEIKLNMHGQTGNFLGVNYIICWHLCRATKEGWEV